MAAASDKARFYLEQYVPELQEYAQKKLFSRDEIASITSKRSDFEHTLNARGSWPSDYVSYAQYEMTLDRLKKKRCRRLGVKTTEYSGQRTVFFILDRGTKKFPGDMGLWMQYIDFCRKSKASKKLTKVFTQVLRLKPREASLWITAAKYFAEAQGDMATARGYMQRGLRFCPDKQELWIEYFKMECVYLAKLEARREILGLSDKKRKRTSDEDGNDEQNEVEDEDMIILPTITAEDFDPDASKGIEQMTATALQQISETPAFSGAIPIAIFDGAVKAFSNNPLEIAEGFFQAACALKLYGFTSKLLEHILDYLKTTAPTSPECIICECRLDLHNVEAASPDFPPLVGAVVSRLTKGLSEADAKEKPSLAEKALELLLPYLEKHEQLDAGIVQVLEAVLNRYLKVVIDALNRRPAQTEEVRRVVKRLGGNKLSALNMDRVLGLESLQET